MPYILNQEGTWEHTTEAAKKRLKYLEKAGYLHSDYSRFEEITDYKTVYYKNVLSKLADKVIARQEAREKAIYADLGVSGVNDLNKKIFSDEALETFIGGNLDNAFRIIGDSLKEAADDTTYMSRKVENIDELVNKVSSTFEKDLNKMSENYVKNLKKIDKGGLISGDELKNNSEVKQIAKMMANNLSGYTNKRKDGEFKTAQEVASAAFRGMKGKMLEQCIGMFFAQLKKVKGIKVTGTDLDIFGKDIKSDTIVYTKNYSIGITAKNYATELNSKGQLALKKEINLHSGGSFDTFIKRLESFKNGDFQSDLGTITKRLTSDNYYYNLINEAANKVSFKSSDPAQDFLNIVKDLAAAWFGTQFVTDTKEQAAGQNVDFLALNDLGLIPMSVLLRALREESSNINVSIESKTDIDLEDLYEKKVNAKHGKYTYSGEEVTLGSKAGEEVYKDIEMKAIRLHLILNTFNLKGVK